MQANPAITDVERLTNLICYKQISIIANVKKIRKWLEGLKVYIHHGRISVTLGTVIPCKWAWLTNWATQTIWMSARTNSTSYGIWMHETYMRLRILSLSWDGWCLMHRKVPGSDEAQQRTSLEPKAVWNHRDIQVQAWDVQLKAKW